MKTKSAMIHLERTALFAGLAALLLALVSIGIANAHAESQTVFGIWETRGGKSHVRIEPCSNGICGKIIWLKEPVDAAGQPKRDRNNRKEDLKSRPLIGLPMLTGFQPGDDAGLFEDGTIYNPEDGNSYSSEMALQEDGRLKVEGCVLFICKEQLWTRVP